MKCPIPKYYDSLIPDEFQSNSGALQYYIITINSNKNRGNNDMYIKYNYVNTTKAQHCNLSKDLTSG